MKIRKLINPGQLAKELDVILGSDHSRWNLQTEEVRAENGNKEHIAVVTILDPALDSSGVQAVLDAHVAVPDPTPLTQAELLAQVAAITSLPDVKVFLNAFVKEQYRGRP